MEFLESYPWPGNVRELENTIERTVVLAGGEALTAKDIPILNSMVEAPDPVPVPAATNGVVTFSPLSRRSKERQLYERVPLREKDIARPCTMPAASRPMRPACSGSPCASCDTP